MPKRRTPDGWQPAGAQGNTQHTQDRTVGTGKAIRPSYLDSLAQGACTCRTTMPAAYCPTCTWHAGYAFTALIRPIAWRAWGSA